MDNWDNVCGMTYVANVRRMNEGLLWKVTWNVGAADSATMGAVHFATVGALYSAAVRAMHSAAVGSGPCSGCASHLCQSEFFGFCTWNCPTPVHGMQTTVGRAQSRC